MNRITLLRDSPSIPQCYYVDLGLRMDGSPHACLSFMLLTLNMFAKLANNMSKFIPTYNHLQNKMNLVCYSTSSHFKHMILPFWK